MQKRLRYKQLANKSLVRLAPYMILFEPFGFLYYYAYYKNRNLLWQEKALKFTYQQESLTA